MTRALVSSALLGIVLAAASESSAAAVPSAAETFTDQACPSATPLGRHLNELNAQAQPSSDDLVATANGLVAAYRDCVTSFDRETHAHGGDASSDYVVSHRMYARLALARSLQRTGTYAAQLHDSATAKSNFDEALKSLAEVESIGVAARGSEGAETKLLQSSRSLHDDLVTAEKALPAAGASPAPTTTGAH